jgi:CDP-diacylglycerol--serine O-phosphatidyltransferase
LLPQHLSKIILIPLLLYALYGIKKNVDRRLSGKSRKQKLGKRMNGETPKSEHSA